MENCECESELHSLHYYLSNHYKKISMLVFNPYIIKKSTECHKIKGFDPPPPSTTVHSDLGDSWSQHSLHQRGSQWQLNVTNIVGQYVTLKQTSS